jgi:hypothetical protein
MLSPRRLRAMSLAYDVGHVVCRVVPFGSCDSQEMTMLGMIMLAVTGALFVLAALSRI